MLCLEAPSTTFDKSSFADDFLENVLKEYFGFEGTLKSFQKESLFHSSYGILFLYYYVNKNGLRITIPFLELLKFLRFRFSRGLTIEQALNALERGGNIDDIGKFSSSQKVVLTAYSSREFEATGLVHETDDNSLIHFHIHPAVLDDSTILLNTGDMYAFATNYSMLQKQGKKIQTYEAIFDEKFHGKLFIPREGIDWSDVVKEFQYKGDQFFKQEIPQEKIEHYFIIYDIDYSGDLLIVKKKESITVSARKEESVAVSPPEEEIIAVPASTPKNLFWFLDKVEEDRLLARPRRNLRFGL